MNERRQDTVQISPIERVLVEVDLLRKEVREARDVSAEQAGKIMGAVGALSDRQSKTEAAVAALAHGQTTLNEEVKRAARLAEEAKRVADQAEHRAATESEAVKAHVAVVQTSVAELRADVAENTVETREQTPKIDRLIALGPKVDRLIEIEDAKAARRKVEDAQAAERTIMWARIYWWLKFVIAVGSCVVIGIASWRWLMAHVH